MIRRTLSFCSCLLLASASLFGQAKPQEHPAPPPPLPGLTGQQAPPIPEVDKTPSPWDSSDGQVSIAVFYWFDQTQPRMFSGRAAIPKANPSDLDFSDKGKKIPGAILSLPAGKDNTIRISYFRSQGATVLTSARDLKFFGTEYPSGTLLNPHYTLQNFKASLDYTSWPFPLKTSRFRFKTLWEVQYTAFQSLISAPVLEATDATLSPAKKTNWFVYPSLGLGMEYSLAKPLRFESQVSGFAFPGRAATWDADAHLALRTGPIEFLGGYRGFHFKTSPKQEEYVRANITGAYVSIRWYPKF